MQSILSMLVSLFRSTFMHQQTMKEIRTGMTQETALQSLLNAFRRGDYETALAFIEGLKDDGNKTPSYCYFRGSLLHHMGDFANAEKWMQESIALAGDDERRALSYSTLGQVLIELRRYDEAMQCFEKSMECSPRRGGAHRDMAELWLRQEAKPQEALRWARQAVEKERVWEGCSREAKNLNLSEDLATLAWAVAETSRDESEVDRLVREAVPLVGTTVVSSAAQVHYHSGLAYLAVGNHEKSAFHFNEAMTLDPNGHWGHAAQRTLVKI